MLLDGQGKIGKKIFSKGPEENLDKPEIIQILPLKLYVSIVIIFNRIY